MHSFADCIGQNSLQEESAETESSRTQTSHTPKTPAKLRSLSAYNPSWSMGRTHVLNQKAVRRGLTGN